MPSAGRPFTPALVTALVARGIAVVPLCLHAGVSSLEAGEAPYPERYDVPAATARLVNAARAGGGRVVAVGTTVVRALETVARPDGVVEPGAGWTHHVVTPEHGVRAVDGLLTGWHEPDASHLLMLEAVGGRELVAASYDAAARGGYRWHEFGDVHLVLPDRSLMRAVVLREFGPPASLAIDRLADPVPGPGQALVEVELASVTFVETQVRAGRPPHPAMSPALPVVPGNGVGGRVAAVGEGADPALVGRRVVTTTGGSGGYAERVAVPAAALLEVPAELDLADAVALLADGRTALSLVEAALPRPGETVLVLAAAGGVGSLLVQLAAAPARASSRPPRASARPRSRSSSAPSARSTTRAPAGPARRARSTSSSTASADRSPARRSTASRSAGASAASGWRAARSRRSPRRLPPTSA